MYYFATKGTVKNKGYLSNGKQILLLRCRIRDGAQKATLCLVIAGLTLIFLGALSSTEYNPALPLFPHFSDKE
jgi:hypothetical protein